MSRLRILLVALFAALSLTAPARAQVPGVCTGRFVNPITDVCWSCLFPISLGAIPIWPSGKADPANPASPICLCGAPIPRIGLSVGFWEPVRLADVTKKPWCFVNLGGLNLSPGIDLGVKKMKSNDAAQDVGSWHVHWYAYPLIYWMELLADFLCLEPGSLDIAYISELDPLWNNDELTFLLNPEAVLFGNLIAQAACAADCAAATVHLPIDQLFWCAGCVGGMYPMNGNIQAEYGQVQGSVLAVKRMAYKLHRQLLALGTMGSAGLCSKYPMPIMRKQQYRTQIINPVPAVVGPSTCPPMGRTQTLYESFKMIPIIGEDFGYLIWRKRNCCIL
ncbi:MAG: conjugal transfer pilus assembly protein TraU [Pseudomonadota bacterium]